MTDEKREATTNELVADAAATRTRVATDVERLATQLAPQQLKNRALSVTERSLEGIALRALGGLLRSPRRLAAYVRQHPVAGSIMLAGTGVIVWRLALGRRRH